MSPILGPSYMLRRFMTIKVVLRVIFNVNVKFLKNSNETVIFLSESIHELIRMNQFT